jgi:hypothetical protein
MSYHDNDEYWDAERLVTDSIYKLDNVGEYISKLLFKSPQGKDEYSQDALTKALNHVLEAKLLLKGAEGS